MHHKVYNTTNASQHKKKSRIKVVKNHHHRRRLGGWSRCYYVSTCRRARSSAMIDQTTVYEKLASIKEHQNEEAERLK
jgi:hypothetical protein